MRRFVREEFYICELLSEHNSAQLHFELIRKLSQKDLLVGHILSQVIMETLSQSPVELKAHAVLLPNYIEYIEFVLEFSSFLVIRSYNAREGTD